MDPNLPLVFAGGAQVGVLIGMGVSWFVFIKPLAQRVDILEADNE